MSEWTIQPAPPGMSIQRSDAKQSPYYQSKSARKPPLGERPVIAWDMEGLSLSGEDKPQHPVLFGCSADVENPLEAFKLTARSMLHYIIEVGAANPHAIHVGFGFRYDANMIVASLPLSKLRELYKHHRVYIEYDEHTYMIKWLPGKMFTVTRQPAAARSRKSRHRVSVTIYDYSSFFGKSFLNVAAEILREDLSDDDRDVIAHGKEARGKQGWNDFPEIRHYWQREIVLIRRVFETFRDVMYRAGFRLTEWYGPGALANYINSVHGIRAHLGGVQTTSGAMPADVHRASKSAFSGGRFELFKGGRIGTSVHAVDINSAYPYALTKLPSFDPNEGEWVYVRNPVSIARVGVYRIHFTAPDAQPLEYRPMPFFWRDKRGMISYPQFAHGWYWSPEAAIATKTAGAQIVEGWEWRSNEDVFPWEFLYDMYNTRQRLGKQNILSMPFKLGPNSLYGKYAQTVGYNKKKNLPPKSHALPVAGWVTSYCRSMLYHVMSQIPDHLIAVETDSVFTDVDPRELNISIGDGLGEWSVNTYDDMMYIQSGLYHTKSDGEWTGTKSRGITKAEYTHEMAEAYLKSLPANDTWGTLTVETNPRFIGLGAAIAAKEDTKDVHTAWLSQTREIGLGDTGKRKHSHHVCPQCDAGLSPWEQPHSLFINSQSDGMTLSHPRRLPWESEQQYEDVAEMRHQLDVERDQINE